MIHIDQTIPQMDVSSAVYPTVRQSNRSLALAYHLPECSTSAVIQFMDVLEWHYGYPNDEGLDAHPLWGNGLEFYGFHVTPAATHGERAWIATFHDGTFTIYAKSVVILSRKVFLDPTEALNFLLGPGDNLSL